MTSPKIGTCTVHDDGGLPGGGLPGSRSEYTLPEGFAPLSPPPLSPTAAFDPAQPGGQTLTDMMVSGGRPHEMTAAQIAATRTYLLRDHFAFSYIIAGNRDLYPPVHAPISALLERWGQDGWRRIMVQCPRGSFKTVHATLATTLQMICRNPNTTIAIFNEKVERVERWLLALQSIVTSNPLFPVLFPDILPPGLSPADRAAGRSMPKSWKWSSREMNFSRNDWTLKEPTVTALGVGAASAGGHYEWCILDDIISEEARRSPIVMQAAKEWLDTAKYLGPTEAQWNALINCTRWAFNDVYEYAAKNQGFTVYRRSAIEDGKSYWEDRYPLEHLLKDQARNPTSFSCTPAGTKITMSDWTLKNIEDVQVGDEVVGFDIGSREAGNTRLHPTKVIAVGKQLGMVWEYRLEDGATIRCTEDHSWFKRPADSKREAYGSLGDLHHPQIVNRLHSIFNPTIQDQIVGSYLGGIFDGEGTLSAKRNGVGGFIAISQSPDHNPETYTRILESLDQLGFKYGIHIRPSRPGHKEGAMIYLKASDEGRAMGLDVKARFLQLCNPAKRDKVVATMWTARWRQRVRVVSRRCLGLTDVYALQTESGNYIADGYASRNCQMLNQPVVASDLSFDAAWLRIVNPSTDDFGEPILTIPAPSYTPFATLLPTETPPTTVHLSDCTKVLLVDPAPSSEQDKRRQPGSRTAMILKARDPWGRRYKLDAWAGREEPIPEVRRMLKMMQRWGCDRIAVEEVNFSRLYRPIINLLADQEFGGWKPRYVPLLTRGRDKDTRIAGKRGSYEAGFEYHTPAVDPLWREEFLAYPTPGFTRDLLDADAYDEDPGVLPRPESEEERTTSADAMTPMDRYGQGADPMTGY